MQPTTKQQLLLLALAFCFPFRQCVAQQLCQSNGNCEGTGDGSDSVLGIVSRAITCPASDCDATGILQHHVEDAPIGFSVACQNGDGSTNTASNNYLRCFDDLVECSGTRVIDSVFFRVGALRGVANVVVTVHLYKSGTTTTTGCASAANVGNLRVQNLLVASTDVVVPIGSDQAFTVEFDTTITLSPSESLLVEISVPSLENQGAFYLGDNGDPNSAEEVQCAPSWLQTVDCPINNPNPLPFTTASIGFPRVSHIIAVNTSPDPSAAPSSTPTTSPMPSPAPTADPTATPTTAEPTGTPTADPTATPTTAEPSGTPTNNPTATPTTPEPTGTPTNNPTRVPTTAAPTRNPTPPPLPPVPPAGSPVPAPPAFCLSGNMLVRCRDGWVRMDAVRVGDYLQTAGGLFSRVYSLAHYSPDMVTTFLQFFFASESTMLPLEITSDHLIVLQNGTAVRAGRVQVGDTVLLAGNTTTTTSSSVVTAIRTIQRKGAYAPLTEAGTYLVNGNVQVSNYVGLWKETSLLFRWPLLVSEHTWGQLLFSPVRMYCRLRLDDACAAETHDEVTGFSNLYGWMIELLVRIGQWDTVVSTSLALLALPVLTLLWMTEQVLLLLVQQQQQHWSVTALLIVGAPLLFVARHKRRSSLKGRVAQHHCSRQDRRRRITDCKED